MKPPVTVRVQGPVWEVVMEIPGIYGTAAGVASRFRASGLRCQRKGDEVIINANFVPEHMK